MDLKSYSYWIIAFALVTFQLWMVNLTRSRRYRQYWLPGSAGVLVLVALFGYQDFIEPLMTDLLTLLQQAGIPWPPVTGDFPLTYNLLVLVTFLIFKIISLSFLALLAWVSKIFAQRRKGTADSPGGGSQISLPRWSWAYASDPERGILLRQEWVYPGIFLNVLGMMIFFWLAICAYQLVHPLPVPMTKFPALSLLLVLEMAWYLGGLRQLEAPGKIMGEDVSSQRLAEYTALWEEYQKIWPERVLAAGLLHDDGPAPPVEPVTRQFGETAQEEEILAIINSLRLQGFPLTTIQQHILEQLWRGQDIILCGVWYDEVAPILFAYLNHSGLEGRRAAVITATPEEEQAVLGWLNQWLQKISTKVGFKHAASYQDYRRSRDVPDILAITIDELNYPDIGEDFLSINIQTVIIAQASWTLGHHLGLLQAFLQRLNGYLKGKVHYIVLSPERYGLESAMRRNISLDANSREFKLTRPRAQTVFTVLWSLEGEEWWQSRFLHGNITSYLGSEPVLALLAWRDGIKSIVLVQHESLPLKELLQEVDNHLPNLNAHARLNHRLHGSIHQAVSLPMVSWLCAPLDQGVVLVRDEQCNLTAALDYWQTSGNAVILLHVVSPPYLLRDYLAQNAAYFLTAPLLALEPRIMKSKFSVAFSLLQRLIAVDMRETDVSSELREIYTHPGNAADHLTELFREVFNVDVIRDSLLHRRRRPVFDENGTDFREEITLRLDGRILECPGLAFLERWLLKDSQQNVLTSIRADHLPQTYLPGQVHTLNGRPYRIIRFDPNNHCVHAEHCPLKGELHYRPHLHITMEGIQELYHAGHRTQQQRGPWMVTLHLREGDFTISRPGYVTFLRGFNITPVGHRYESVNPDVAPPSSYQNGRLLSIDLVPCNDRQTPSAKIAFTLAMLLNESFYTLFPDSWRFLHATTPLSEDFFNLEPLQKLFPQLRCQPAVPARLFPQTTSPMPAISLVIVEDSQIDLGLVQCLFDDWQYVFMVLEDYLAWLLEEEEFQLKPGWRQADGDKLRFLKYGLPELPGEFDLPGALQVLREIGPYQVNTSCCQYRRRFNSQRMDTPPTEMDPSPHVCDFCARGISSAEIELLQDGRERCRQCQASAIDKLTQLTHVFQEGRQFFGQSLGLDIRQSLQVSFTDAQTLHQAAGSYFLPTLGYDPRTVGLAVQQGDTFVIRIENGQPYHLTLATIVHELTHIWQYDNLDYNRIVAEQGKLLVEGLAVWAELTCLEEKHLAGEYRQQQASREDEYGQGYRLVLKILADDGHSKNPFIVLKRRYPISGGG